MIKTLQQTIKLNQDSILTNLPDLPNLSVNIINTLINTHSKTLYNIGELLYEYDSNIKLTYESEKNHKNTNIINNILFEIEQLMKKFIVICPNILSVGTQGNNIKKSIYILSRHIYKNK